MEHSYLMKGKVRKKETGAHAGGFSDFMENVKPMKRSKKKSQGNLRQRYSSYGQQKASIKQKY